MGTVYGGVSLLLENIKKFWVNQEIWIFTIKIVSWKMFFRISMKNTVFGNHPLLMIYCALLHDSHFMIFVNVQYLFNHLNVSKQAVNTKKVFGALLTALSKALFYLPHELINS